MSAKKNHKPKRVSSHWEEKANKVMEEVIKAGGIKTWRDGEGNSLNEVWIPEVQRLLEQKNYQVGESKIFYTITVMNPHYIKKMEIKEKMDAVFKD